MSRLVAARVMPERNLANEILVELTWETLDIRKGDFAAVLRHWDGKAPTKKHTEIRPYANVALAAAAIKIIAPALDLS